MKSKEDLDAKEKMGQFEDAILTMFEAESAIIVLKTKTGVKTLRIQVEVDQTISMLEIAKYASLAMLSIGEAKPKDIPSAGPKLVSASGKPLA